MGIAKEWNSTKNGDLKPSDVTGGSGKIVWWKCARKHEWKARISDRTKNGQGCPYCMGRRVLEGYNDLATVKPDLAKEWHPTKNHDLKPTEVSSGCNKKVWWKCSICGKEWEAVINNRSRGSRCPECSKTKKDG